jgi:hypothetical protein
MSRLLVSASALVLRSGANAATEDFRESKGIWFDRVPALLNELKESNRHAGNV